MPLFHFAKNVPELFYFLVASDQPHITVILRERFSAIYQYH